jgi:hypothetical protein
LLNIVRNKRVGLRKRRAKAACEAHHCQCESEQLHNRRKLRIEVKQTSDNMDRGKAEVGREEKRRVEKRREEKRKSEKKEGTGARKRTVFFQ